MAILNTLNALDNAVLENLNKIAKEKQNKLSTSGDLIIKDDVISFPYDDSFYTGVNNVSAINDLPVDKQMVVVSLSNDEEFGFNSIPFNGAHIDVIIKPIGLVKITIPSDYTMIDNKKIFWTSDNYIIHTDSNGSDIYLHTDQNEYTGNYMFVGTDALSAVYIDNDALTVENETSIGTFHEDITSIDPNNLKEIYIDGNISLTIGGDENNDVTDTVKINFDKLFSRSLQSFCDHLAGLSTLSITGCIPTSVLRLCRGCNNLKDLYLDTDMSLCTSMQEMFNSCSSLESLDVSSWGTSKNTSCTSMFQSCESLSSINGIENLDMSSCTDANRMFQNCSSLTSLNLNNWNTSSFDSMKYMFYNCSNLTELVVDDFDISNATDIDEMFHYCSSLESLDVSKWTTSNISSLEYVFAECNSLKSLDLSRWDITNITDMTGVFTNDKSLTSIGDVSKWNTSKVTSFFGLFDGCSLLNGVDASKWDTISATNMGYMFYGCESLTTITDLSGWETNNLTNIYGMFSKCSSISTLNLSGWNISNTTDISYLFNNCTDLVTLNIDGWDFSNVTTMNYTFSGCVSLVNITGTFSNIMINFDLSDCPLSRLTALRVIDALYDYSRGETHTCKFSDHTLQLLLKEDFQEATDKNWNIGEYVEITDEAGDVVYWCEEFNRMITVKPKNVSEDNYPIDSFTPIGIITIPSSHDVYGTGEGAMMSLVEMSYSTPDSGQLTSSEMYWGQNGVDTSLPNLNTCVVTGTTASPTEEASGTHSISYLPSDDFSTSNPVCPTDPLAYYHYNSSSYYAAPSPYLSDGSRNPVYYQTESPSSELNCLADFDGIGNTNVLLDLVTAQPDWKTDETITESSDSGYSPAACCCWRFSTPGTKQGDWYLPACGELGYVLVRRKAINDTINTLNEIYGTIGLVVSSSDHYWSSSEYSSTYARYIRFYGGVSDDGKNSTNLVRAFARV